MLLPANCILLSCELTTYFFRSRKYFTGFCLVHLIYFIILVLAVLTCYSHPATKSICCWLTGVHSVLSDVTGRPREHFCSSNFFPSVCALEIGHRGDTPWLTTSKDRNKDTNLVIREKYSPLRCLYSCTHLHSPNTPPSKGSKVFYVIYVLL